jgi:hypothetical protein
VDLFPENNLRCLLFNGRIMIKFVEGQGVEFTHANGFKIKFPKKAGESFRNGVEVPANLLKDFPWVNS